jgi:hypothetical protein
MRRIQPPPASGSLLGAIPIAGTIQILLLDWLEVRRARRTEAVLDATRAPDAATPAGTPAS